MIRHATGTLLLAGLVLTGCAGMGPPAAGPSLALPGDDDAAGTRQLAGFLLEHGWPAEPSGSGQAVFVYRHGASTLLSPVLRSRGLDRLIATRSYATGPGKAAADLEGLAGRLNGSLNVGSFAVSEGALLFESHLTFVDRLGLDELEAFLAWMTDVEVAIAEVDGGAGTLLLTVEP